MVNKAGDPLSLARLHWTRSQDMIIGVFIDVVTGVVTGVVTDVVA
jgi:hypothetical protein